MKIKYAYRPGIRSFLFILLALPVLSGCTKMTNKDIFKVITKKDGVWHIDRMKVVRITYSNNKVDAVDMHYDVGDFIFSGEEASDAILKFDSSVDLDPYTSLHYGPFELPLWLTSTEFSTGTEDIGSTTLYRITYLSKDKMNLFVPREVNPYSAGAFEFNFYFECSRKK